MAGIVFWFENNDRDVFSGRKVDLDAWRYAVKAGGIEKARCFNATELEVKFDKDFDFEVAGKDNIDFLDWVDSHKEENLVFFDTEWSCPESAIPISDLDHSTVDWYIFGAANGFHSDILRDHNFVYLPINGMGALHSVHIASAVLLRRWETIR